MLAQSLFISIYFVINFLSSIYVTGYRLQLYCRRQRRRRRSCKVLSFGKISPAMASIICVAFNEWIQTEYFYPKKEVQKLKWKETDGELSMVSLETESSIRKNNWNENFQEKERNPGKKKLFLMHNCNKSLSQFIFVSQRRPNFSLFPLRFSLFFLRSFRKKFIHSVFLQTLHRMFQSNVGGPKKKRKISLPCVWCCGRVLSGFAFKHNVRCIKWCKKKV